MDIQQLGETPIKLIKELTEEVEYITEDNGEGGKNLYISGPFLQGGIVNKNKRMYPLGILENEVARYTKAHIDKKNAFGELGHPDSPKINLSDVSHRITELKQDGQNFIGKAVLIPEGKGKIAIGILQTGGTLGVSSRGLGTVKPNSAGIMEVQSDFILNTAADIVVDPSAPDAFVQGIMEGADWILDVVTGNWKLQRIVEQTKKLNTRQLQEQKIRIFKSFISKL